MKVNSEIFRAYDIRGIVDEALTEEGIFQIGKAIGSHILSEGRSSILTARDGRISVSYTHLTLPTRNCV